MIISKRQGNLKYEISRKDIARRLAMEKRSVSKEELFEEDLEGKMNTDIMEEVNDHGNSIDAIKNINLETIDDLFEL